MLIHSLYYDQGSQDRVPARRIARSYMPQPLRHASTLLRVVFGRFRGQIEFFWPILYKKRDLGIKVD